jgi:hypothetical protein
MNNTIYKKIVFMLVILLFLPLASAYRPNEEILDQSTPLGYGEYLCGISNNYLAQAFKPKLPVLSKVELGLFKSDNITGNITISIREKLKGEDLVSKIVSLDEVPWTINAGWVTVDFDDITVTPNHRYYIVLTNDDTKDVLWIMTYYNPYWRGRPWVFGGSLPFWVPVAIILLRSHNFPDFSFRTYGHNTMG